MKNKCQHPDDSVLQTKEDKPWEGRCQLCGKRVKLMPVTDKDTHEKPL